MDTKEKLYVQQNNMKIIKTFIRFSLFLKCWLISVYIGFFRHRGVSKKVGPDIENLKTPKYHETGQIDFPWLKVYILVARI